MQEKYNFSAYPISSIRCQINQEQIDWLPDFTASTFTVKPVPGVWVFWLLNRIINGDTFPMLACVYVLVVVDCPHNLLNRNYDKFWQNKTIKDEYLIFSTIFKYINMWIRLDNNLFKLLFSLVSNQIVSEF